jgi:hypothetical protein
VGLESIFEGRDLWEEVTMVMKIERSNPLKGVSGVFTLNSTLAAITRAKGSGGAMQIC